MNEALCEVGKKVAVATIAIVLTFGATACSSSDGIQSPDGYDVNMDPEK